MNYLKITKHDIANGPGVRVVLWVSGCTCKCKGCHNPQSWDFCAGQLFDEKAKKELFTALSELYIRGLTLSGGHPLEKQNAKEVLDLVKEIKKKFPEKDIWLYTGYKLDVDNFITRYGGETEKDVQHNTIQNIIEYCDVIVDGPYIEEQRDISLAFCGSKNQRIIDVQSTIQQEKIVLLEKV